MPQIKKTIGSGFIELLETQSLCDLSWPQIQDIPLRSQAPPPLLLLPLMMLLAACLLDLRNQQEGFGEPSRSSPSFLGWRAEASMG